MRTSRSELATDALDALTTAFAQAGLKVERKSSPGQRGTDLVLDGPNGAIPLEVKVTSVADPGRIAAMVHSAHQQTGSDPSDAGAVVLVADELSEAARALLREEGWGYFDRRGRLWFRGNGIIINDTGVDPQPRFRSEASDRNPLTGRVALGMAVWLLMHPDQFPGVRALSRELECSPSSAHDALKRLKDTALVSPDNRPLTPELFWAVADVWRPERHYVRHQPPPGDDGAAISADESGLAFVVSNDVAAAAWGAPVVVRSGARIDFYVPAAALNRVLRLLEPAGISDAGASVSAAPISAVWREGFDHPSPALPWLGWPLAHPVIVALDLALDRSRGREIVDDWDPPSEVRRVW